METQKGLGKVSLFMFVAHSSIFKPLQSFHQVTVVIIMHVCS